MIIQETLFTIQCDICKEQTQNDEIGFWAEESDAENNAMEDGWHEDGGKHYCPECHSFNDNDELVLNKERQKI